MVHFWLKSSIQGEENLDSAMGGVCGAWPFDKWREIRVVVRLYPWTWENL
jgi:hypothetical protein